MVVLSRTENEVLLVTKLVRVRPRTTYDYFQTNEVVLGDLILTLLEIRLEVS